MLLHDRPSCRVPMTPDCKYTTSQRDGQRACPSNRNHSFSWDHKSRALLRTRDWDGERGPIPTRDEVVQGVAATEPGAAPPIGKSRGDLKLWRTLKPQRKGLRCVGELNFFLHARMASGDTETPQGTSNAHHATTNAGLHSG